MPGRRAHGGRGRGRDPRWRGCARCGVLMMDVAAEYLVAGQGRLLEPGALPQGARLGPWLGGCWQGRRGSQASAEASGLRSPDEAGEVGTPESVKPIYVRSPDADIHITKMKDPWGDGPGQAMT